MDEPFYLFAGMSYYPGGGFRDFKGKFATIEDALIALANSPDSFDWWYIVEVSTDADPIVVREGSRP